MNLTIIKHPFTQLTLALLFILVSSISSAQTIGPDIVELTNGTSHQGTIIEQHPGKFLKLLQQPSNDTLTFNYGDISVLRKVPEAEAVSSNEENLVEEIPTSRFNQNTYSMYFSYSINGGNWYHHGAGAGLLRKFTPKIQAGIGAYVHAGPGVYYYNSTAFTGEFRYLLQSSLEGRLSLLFSCALGYQYYFDSERVEEGVPTYISNGVYFSPSIGYRLNFTKNIGMTIGLGYNYMGGKKRRQSNDEILKNKHISNLSLKASIFF